MPPAFLMIWMYSRLFDPFRRSTASTASAADTHNQPATERESRQHTGGNKSVSSPPPRCCWARGVLGEGGGGSIA